MLDDGCEKATFPAVSLSVRVSRGTPLVRGSTLEHTFETLFFLREGARPRFEPYAVLRTTAQYVQLHTAWVSLTKDFLPPLDSEFPFIPSAADQTNSTEQELATHTELLGEWTYEVLAKFVGLKEQRRLRVAELIFSFFEVNLALHGGKQRRITKSEDAVLECKQTIREKLLAGYKHPVATGNARFAKHKRKEVKSVRRFTEHLERLERTDYFEHRLDANAGGLYLFNPWTGEEIRQTENGIDRNASHWKPADDFPSQTSPGVSSMLLMPQFYALRKTVRQVTKPASTDQAATLMCAVARGSIVRTRLRAYHRKRYQKVLDEATGYFYFRDTFSGLTSWTKPRLAHPFDIRETPADLRKANDSANDGPLHRSRVGKGRKGRLQPGISVTNHDEAAPESAREPAMIDIETTPYQIVVLWLEANIDKFPLYRPLKELLAEEDWCSLLLVLQKRTDDPLAQSYCLHAFSRMPISEQNGLLAAGPQEVLAHLVETLSLWANSKKFGCNLLMFLGNALLRMLENHSVRLAFFSVAHLEREARPAVAGLTGEAEEYLTKKLAVFGKLLRCIPVQIFQEQAVKGYKDVATVDVARPTARGTDFTEIVLQIIAQLLHERDTRDLLCECLGRHVVSSLRVVDGEPFALQYGLRCLYNCVYMCPAGWRYMVERTDARELLKEVRAGPLGGDADIVRELRRCELAMAELGWRGDVERDIEEEMKAEQQGFIAAYASRSPSPIASPLPSPDKMSLPAGSPSSPIIKPRTSSLNRSSNMYS